MAQAIQATSKDTHLKINLILFLIIHTLSILLYGKVIDGFITGCEDDDDDDDHDVG